MKGDFSRIRFNPGRHYTSVLEQQGRVSLDADSNEQRWIDEYIRRIENDDIIGKYGAPRHDAGFEITLGADGLQAGPGRYYVNGILCENESQVNYDNQPCLLNPPSQALLLSELRAGKFNAVQVFLEVWQRLVTALDDSCLREPALGQADTTARLQTVWRIVAEGALSPTPAPPANLPSVSASLNPAAAFTRAAINNANPQLSQCCLGMYSSIAERTNLGKLAAQTSGQTADCGCQPTPAAGYRGLENQLYRVEIHLGGDESTATFKWSRENASVAVAVTSVSGSDVMVDSLGPDANLGFLAGEWVEISDDTFLFGVPPNQAGELYQIAKTTPEQLTLTVDRTVAAVDPNRNARLRRWEQSGATVSAAGVPLSPGTWMDLENGIQVQFAAGQYESGDYWLIPARAASGQIEWPPCGSDGAEFQPPKYVHVHRAPLACIHLADTRRKNLTIDDCRLFFLPLTELGADQVPPALHVKAMNWVNDDFLTLDQLVTAGLKVTLDAPFTGHVDASTFIVSLEVPATQNEFFKRAAATGSAAMLRTSYVLDGVVTVKESDLIWQLPRDLTYTWYLVDQLLLPGAAIGQWTRARIKLPGHVIFNSAATSRVFLDGQSYGADALRRDGKTPRIDLQLPSGNSQKASDFDSWFYLAPALSISSFAIQPAAVKLIRSGVLGDFTVVDAKDKSKRPAALTPTGTITLSYPALADTVVNLSVSGGTAGILSVPDSATVPAGQQSVQFQVGVNNPGANTQNYQLNALLALAGNLNVTGSAAFSVTGFAGPKIPLINVGNLSELEDALATELDKTITTAPASRRARPRAAEPADITPRSPTPEDSSGGETLDSKPGSPRRKGPPKQG